MSRFCRGLGAAACGVFGPLGALLPAAVPLLRGVGHGLHGAAGRRGDRPGDKGRGAAEPDAAPAVSSMLK